VLIEYCQKVQRITYQNMGTSNHYNQVINMDQKSGTCTFGRKEFSGPLAPFGEPVCTVFNTP
jgi:hypothetical protein